MLDDMAAKNPKAASADPKTYVDLSLVGRWKLGIHQAAVQEVTDPGVLE